LGLLELATAPSGFLGLLELAIAPSGLLGFLELATAPIGLLFFFTSESEEEYGVLRALDFLSVVKLEISSFLESF
jgi:hypothetical protein